MSNMNVFYFKQLNKYRVNNFNQSNSDVDFSILQQNDGVVKKLIGIQHVLSATAQDSNRPSASFSAAIADTAAV